MARATDEQLAERISFAVSLRMQGATPRTTMAKLVGEYGVSVKQARRYLALANEELKEEGIADPSDPFGGTVDMMYQRIEILMMEATPTEAAKLVNALGKLREMRHGGPSLNDKEIVNRAAFVGGADALGRKQGQELRQPT